MAQRAEDVPLYSRTFQEQQSTEFIALRTSHPESLIKHAVNRLSNLTLERKALEELVQFRESSVHKGVGLPSGNEQPVILVQGYLGPIPYLLPLAHTLKEANFRPKRSGFFMNFALMGNHIRHLENTIEKVAKKHGKVKLVSHSLGGVIAKVAAQRHPDKIDSMIDLATPHRGPIYELVSNLMNKKDRDLLNQPLPENITFTNIFSSTDGIIGRDASITDDQRAIQVEVEGTHSGLAWNINAVINTVHALAT